MNTENLNIVKPRKVAQYQIPMDVMGIFTKDHTFKIKEGLPQDAVLLGVNMDYERNMLILFVESDTFLEVAGTDTMPTRELNIQTIE